jgi:subtilase family serine protease
LKDFRVLACLFLALSLGSNLLVFQSHPVSADSGGVYVYPFHLAGINPDSSSPHGLTPAQIHSAYDLPSTGGTGTIAIVDAFDDPTILNDSNVFSSQFGLPFLNSTNFEKHMMASNVSFDPGWATEISLDVEWAHAIAPNAKILLVEATSNEAILPNGTAGPLLNAVDYARNQSDVVAVSMSWGTGSGGLTSMGYNETAYNSFFTSPYNAIFFAGSGDQAENASWPASSPNVVGVGGTTLNFNPDGSVANETVWNDGGYATGGGVSPSEPEPSYQVSYGVQSNGHRAVPDVSYCADQNPGYPVFANFSGGQWQVYGGTSFGTPMGSHSISWTTDIE